MQNTDKFDQWAILELFGRQRFAGRVSEALIAGAPFIRLDVPEVEGQAAFTRFFGGAAVYGISPVSEEIARRIAASTTPEPVTVYELRAPSVDIWREGDPAPDPDDGPGEMF